MSTLSDNLQQIYTTKLQLKQAIGTSSDIFEDYPSYVANMVTPTGTINISDNGTTNVSAYAYAYVSGIGGGSTGTQLSYVWGADEYDANVFIPFTDNGTSYSYSVTWQWDGLNQTWESQGQQSGFSLCCRVGNETSYEYINDHDVLVNTYRGVQMHVANGSLYFGDLLTNIPTLDEHSGSISIAADLGSSQFYNNGFWASPDNFNPDCESGTLTFTLTVPKDFYYSFGTGYDKIDSGDVRTVNHPTVTLAWTWVEDLMTCPDCGVDDLLWTPSGDHPCDNCGYNPEAEPEEPEEPEEEPEE